MKMSHIFRTYFKFFFKRIIFTLDIKTQHLEFYLRGYPNFSFVLDI